MEIQTTVPIDTFYMHLSHFRKGFSTKVLEMLVLQLLNHTFSFYHLINL